MNQIMTIERGVSPPQDSTRLWLDTSVAGSRVDQSRASRWTPFSITRADAPYLTGYSAEASFFWSKEYNYMGCVYFVGPGVIAFAQSLDWTSRDPYTWVHAATAIPHGATYDDHQCVHEHNGILYYIGALGTGATSMRLFTAPVPPFGVAPTWTDQGNMPGVTFTSGVNGNAGLAWLPNGKVLLFLETLQAGQWRTGVYMADTALGPWTMIHSRMDELAPRLNIGYGGPYPVVENNGITLLYHSSDARPSIGCKARTQFDGFENLGNWELLTDLANPFVSRQHPYEVDQVADLFTAYDGNGVGAIGWSGNCNAANMQAVIISVLQPTLRFCANGRWVPVHTGENMHSRREWVDAPRISNADSTVLNNERILIQNLAADRICTLPRAAFGSRVQIIVGGNSGAFGVTPTVLAGTNSVTGLSDTIETAAGTKILQNQTRTLACYADGTWQLES